MKYFAATLVLLGICACGKKGGLQFQDNPSSHSSAFQCDAGSDPSPSQLRRLTNKELTNTLTDLVGATAVANAKVFLDALPREMEVSGFNNIERSVSAELIKAQFDVATLIADYLTADGNRLTPLSGNTCIRNAALTTDCVRGFISAFGAKAFRRPLSAGEISDYYGVYLRFSAAANRNGVKALISSMLQSPRFLYIIETDGTGLRGRDDLFELSAYAKASRISYLFWKSMPDAELFQAAADGRLDTADGYKAQVMRAFQNPRTRAAIRDFYQQWLQLGQVPQFNQVPAFLGAINTNNLRTEMINEVSDFIDHVIWERKAGTDELLTSDVSFAKTSALSQVYQVPAWTAGTAPVRFPAGTRSGLLTRAALLAGAEEENQPFTRGNRIMAQILCQPAKRPDPNSLPMGALDNPELSASLTTRQRYEHKTSSATCMACHSQLNPLGFMLERYDALGRSRSSELIFDEARQVVNNLPVEDVVTYMFGDGAQRTASGAVEFSRLLADHDPRVDQCLTRQWFRYSYGRIETASDGCVLSSRHKDLTNLSIEQMLLNTALDGEFKTKKVGR